MIIIFTMLIIWSDWAIIFILVLVFIIIIFTIVDYDAAEVECDTVDDYNDLQHHSFNHCYHPDHKNLIIISITTIITIIISITTITTIISTRTGEAGWPWDRRSRSSLHPLHF